MDEFYTDSLAVDQATLLDLGLESASEILDDLTADEDMELCEFCDHLNKFS
jgi:hypothetical protein